MIFQKIECCLQCIGIKIFKQFFLRGKSVYSFVRVQFRANSGDILTELLTKAIEFYSFLTGKLGTLPILIYNFLFRTFFPPRKK